MAKKKIIGEVLSRSENTIRIVHVYKTVHPKYQKIIKKIKKILADTNNIEVKIGDQVEIEESRPISKNKSFRVIRVIK